MPEEEDDLDGLLGMTEEEDELEELFEDELFGMREEEATQTALEQQFVGMPEEEDELEEPLGMQEEEDELCGKQEDEEATQDLPSPAPERGPKRRRLLSSSADSLCENALGLRLVSLQGSTPSTSECSEPPLLPSEEEYSSEQEELQPDTQEFLEICLKQSGDGYRDTFTGRPILRSTYLPKLGLYGRGWEGNGRVYRSRSGNVYNTELEPPPLECFNCGEMHWRKDCPFGHG
mmetsp:Transcript_10511/g.19027  ORF Transcript_10511/g.19027 Transcript_10511/m.19027 type:complete len:233 (-) Transcript_10511:164-862(-)